MKRLRAGELEAELDKVTDRRDPPLPVAVHFLGEWRAAVLHGWASNPQGRDVPGVWGLVTGVREYAPGFETEFCTWARSDSIRRR